jgi:hypothetical protein
VIHPQVLELDHVATDLQEMLRRTLGEHVELVTTPAGDLRSVLAGTPRCSNCAAPAPGKAAYLSNQVINALVALVEAAYQELEQADQAAAAIPARIPLGELAPDMVRRATIGPDLRCSASRTKTSCALHPDGRAHGSGVGRTVSVRCTVLCQKMPSPLVFAVVGIHTLRTSTIGADQSARSAQAVLVIGQPSGFSSCWPAPSTSAECTGIFDQGLWPVVRLNSGTG